MDREVLEEVRGIRRTLNALLGALQPPAEEQAAGDPVSNLADALQDLSEAVEAHSTLLLSVRSEVSDLRRRLDLGLREPA